ncbi:hypothetical protein ACOSQ3_017011 [Xanthoceras sorbifolium]
MSGNNGDKATPSNIAKTGVKARAHVDNDRKTIKSYKNRGSRFDILEKVVNEEQRIEINSCYGRNNKINVLYDITNGYESEGYNGNNGVGGNGGKVKNHKANKSPKGKNNVDYGLKDPRSKLKGKAKSLLKKKTSQVKVAEEVLKDSGVLKQLHQEVVTFKGFQILDSKPLEVLQIVETPRASIQLRIRMPTSTRRFVVTLGQW